MTVGDTVTAMIARRARGLTFVSVVEMAATRTLVMRRFETQRPCWPWTVETLAAVKRFYGFVAAPIGPKAATEAFGSIC